MIEVTTQEFANIVGCQGDLAINQAELAGKHGGISAVRFQAAEIGPGHASGDALVDQCCVSAAPIVGRLRAGGLNLWGYCVGASFGTERQRRFTDYSVLRQPAARGLVGQPCHERRHAAEDGGVRHSAIFAAPWEMLSGLCRYQSEHANTAIIVSRSADLANDDALDRLLASALHHGSEALGMSINWAALAGAVCAAGDLFLRVSGGFDDRTRAVSFLIDALRPDLLIVRSSAGH